MRIRMLQTVRSDIPFNPCPPAFQGQVYTATENPYGAVAAILRDGRLLGVKPHEYEIVEPTPEETL